MGVKIRLLEGEGKFYIKEKYVNYYGNQEQHYQNPLKPL
jgi:hypothetical protein